MTKMQEIRELLERHQYQVDARAVADALLERLLAGRVAPSARPTH
jgi:anti-sigma28 factor (negative regulator of flagellin synthesis)